ncbi:MAG: saccharopine dehydrogenase C-terminal domain-containing protein [Bacteroidales bacterium]
MKNVLILGAGMVVKPIVKYLLDKNYRVTVATRTKSKADDMIDGHPNGTALAWTVEDESTLNQLIKSHDLTVSLLPWTYHVMVAKHCLHHKKNMVTTSYVKPPMKALDQEAKDAGIIILNELGLDPGIDHMSAMRIIDHVHGQGGKISAFYSLCGALPAPEACDNPFNYKFSWSPKGVVMASNNDGNFLKDGKTIYVTPADLFKSPMSTNFPDVGKLEIYPNRDSLPYIDLYGIPETRTMFRGTFRYPGWCEALDGMKSIRLISDEKFDFTGKTYAEMVAILIGENSSGYISGKVAGYLGIPEDSHAIHAMKWLGLFSHEPMQRGLDSPFEITSDLMISKMMIGREERDMVVMQHLFVATYPDGTKEVIKSSMLDFGSPKTDTAIARTVALPAAMGVEMILERKISITGVHIPVLPEIYHPILDQLESVGIKMVEEFGLPESEFLK